MYSIHELLNNFCEFCQINNFTQYEYGSQVRFWYIRMETRIFCYFVRILWLYLFCAVVCNKRRSLTDLLFKQYFYDNSWQKYINLINCGRSTFMYIYLINWNFNQHQYVGYNSVINFINEGVPISISTPVFVCRY